MKQIRVRTVLKSNAQRAIGDPGRLAGRRLPRASMNWLSYNVNLPSWEIGLFGPSAVQIDIQGITSRFSTVLCKSPIYHRRPVC